MDFLGVEKLTCFQTTLSFCLWIKVMDPHLILHYYPVEKNLRLGLQATKKVSANIDVILLLFVH